MELFEVAVEISPRDGRDRRVDLDHFDARAFAGKLPGHNADTQPDAKCAVNAAGIGAGQIVQHVGEQGGALLLARVVDVLGQVIVQIISPRAAHVLQHLKHAEIRVASKPLDEPGQVAMIVPIDP